MLENSNASIEINHYDGLLPLARGFADGAINLLTVIGPPGIGKSHVITGTLLNQFHIYLNSHVTTLALYSSLYHARHLPVVLDDVDSLMANRATIPVLKSLCELTPERIVRWTTTHPMVGEKKGQLPRLFRTTSPVCLLANSWSSTNADIAAIGDRAVSVKFDPTFDQIHQKAGAWFNDAEVYDFIGTNYCLGNHLSFRTYLKGSALKTCLPDAWRDHVLGMMDVDSRSRAFVAILDDTRHTSEEQRAEAFSEAGLGSRATYFRWKQRFEYGFGRSSRKVSPVLKLLPGPGIPGPESPETGPGDG